MDTLARVVAAVVLSSSFLMAATLPVRAVGAPGPTPDSRPNGWCTVSGDMQAIEIQNCRIAANGAVKVFWDDPALIDASTADALIASTQEAMRRYAKAGFTAADISGLNRVDIAVLPGDGSPFYSWKLGSMSIGAVSAKSLAAAGSEAARFELWHELFHWIQDESYVMAWAALNGDLHWWIETTAEVGTFLIDPAAVAHNLSLYGRSTLGLTSNLVFQLSPLQWAADEQYIHAQRVWSSICPSGCALTRQSFISAINSGSYPLSDDDTRLKFSRGIKRFARYLLTGDLDGAATVGALRSGSSIGDYLALAGAKGAPWRVLTNSFAPQVDAAKNQVRAELQPDSVYPILVTSGPASEPTTGIAYPVGEPAMLVVESGTELWYTVDGGKVQHHSGKKELRLGPIQANLGKYTIRLVAVAKTKPATLRARLEPIDLSGDWLFTVSKGRLISTTCPDQAGDAIDASGDDALELFGRLAAIRGAYKAVAPEAPGELRYVLSPGKDFKLDKDLPALKFRSEISIRDAEAVVTLEVEVPRPKNADVGLPLVALAALIPLGLWPLTRRRLLAPMALLLGATLISGCAVGVTFYGTLEAEMHYPKLEWMGPKTKHKQPQWKLTHGSGTATVDWTVVILSDGKKGKKGKTKQAQRCVAELAIKTSGRLCNDDVVKAPKL